MKALWLDKELQLGETVPIPKPGPGEALVRVLKAGICSTDLEMVKGYYPFKGVLGHEFVGEITEAPEALHRVGERVVGEINIACGNCEFCKKGSPTHCSKRKVLGIKDWNGAFAEYLCLPLKNLLKVPDSVPDDVAVFTEPIAAALEIQKQVRINPEHHVLVVGAGRLGQLIALTTKHIGCDLQVVAKHPKQHKLLELVDITVLKDHEIQEQSFDIVIEAVGSPTGFALASAAVKPQGTIVLKSTYKGKAEIDLSSIVVNEVTLVGSRCGPFESALELLESGEIDPTPLLEKHFDLGDGLEAMEYARRPGVLKVLLEMG